VQRRSNRLKHDLDPTQAASFADLTAFITASPVFNWDAVRSVYDTMKALRNGTRPVDLKNVVSSEILKTLTRAASYDEATRKYLS
jgi:hypothetical protein